jgi:hypothetical protein
MGSRIYSLPQQQLHTQDRPMFTALFQTPMIETTAALVSSAFIGISGILVAINTPHLAWGKEDSKQHGLERYTAMINRKAERNTA